ncbi:MAG: methyltransferase domain-containing protein [Sphingomicrobium sp.]
MVDFSMTFATLSPNPDIPPSPSPDITQDNRALFDTYADIFARRASEYQHAMTAWPDARAAEFRAVLAPFAPAPTGLLGDLPSGGAYLARYLPPGLAYVGVDPAEGFVTAPHAPEARLVRAPITAVPLADASLDHLVSLAGLHHEEDLGAVFAEMRRLLRPGGLAVVADVAAGTPAATFLNGFVDAHNPMGHDGRFLDENTAALVEAAGLTILDDALTSMPWRFASRGEAGAFCKYLFGLPGLGAAAVAEGMAGDIGFDDDADGGVSLRWALRRLVCRAE